MNQGMQRRHWLLVSGVLVVAVLALLWWQSLNFTRERRYVLEEPSGQVLYNPFYAAEKLLQRLGIAAQSVRRVPDFSQLQSNAVLFMRTPSFSLSEWQVEELLDWVERGGRLVMTVYRDYSVEQSARVDHLLDYLAVTVTEQQSGGEIIHAIEPAEASQKSLRIGLQNRFELRDESGYGYASTDRSGHTYLLEYRLGDGWIGLFSELDFLNNWRIADYDHSDYLWQLVHSEEEPGKVWLQYQPYVPGLLELLWRFAWPLLVGLSITLAALLWASSQRLGPVLIGAGREQRSLLEHINASGQFLWRHGEAGKLVDAVRQRTLQRIMQQHPGWQQLSEPEQIEHIAALSGLDKQQVEALLAPAGNPTRQQFLHTVRQLTQIGTKHDGFTTGVANRSSLRKRD